MAEGPPRGLRPIADIITDVFEDPSTPPHVADALQGRPYAFHRDCPCPECMRHYLADSGPKEAA